MAELRLSFPLAGGLHARPATALREWVLAHQAAGTWTNERTGISAALSSVLGLLATETLPGDPCSIRLERSTDGAALDVFLHREFLRVDDSTDAAEASTLPLPSILLRPGSHFWRGTGIAPGIGAGKLRFAARRDLESFVHPPAREPDLEMTEWRGQMEALTLELQKESRTAAHPAQQAILRAHLAMLADAGWTERIASLIQSRQSASAAIVEATGETVGTLEASGSALIRERAQDVRGLAERLLAGLPGAQPAAEALEGPCVFVAEHLAPSRFLALDRRFLQALVLGDGSSTSHTAILARSFGIPCVSGIPVDRGALRQGQEALVDGRRGLLVISPSTETSAYFAVERRSQETRSARAAARAQEPAATGDGTRITVRANISSAEEAARAFAAGAEGVGIFRTEMLFLDRQGPPDEAEQLEAYTHVLQAAGNRPVVLRLLDVGGDKPLPFLPLPAEPNPFLGRRGVRWYPQQPELIRTQVRAALRASQAGELKLLVPMVTDPEEMRWVRNLVESAAQELACEGIQTGKVPALGMMVEVPAAALNLAAFAGVADFFSVGTNDLLQYIFATDRGDPGLSLPNQARHPATLRLLDGLARRAGKLGLDLSLCGEMAADPQIVPLLLGFGITSFSVSVSAVAAIKDAVSRQDLGVCRELAGRALLLDTAEEVGILLSQQRHDSQPGPILSPELVVLNQSCSSKEEAIRTLVEQLYLEGRIEDADAVEALVWAREATYSTGIGHGFAIPHCKVARGSGGLALLRARDPIPWESLDGDPVHTVLLLAAAVDRDEHLRIFARLARRLMDPSFRASVQACATAEALIKLFKSAVLEPA